MDRNSAKKIIMKFGSICFFLIFMLMAAPSSAPMAADTIKIGHLDPFSGPFEYTGRYNLAALQFVVDEQNEKGGLFGKKLEIISEDSEMKPDVAVRKAKKLILENKVNFITNGAGSHISIALAKLATTYKTVTFTHGSMSDDITGKEFSRYFFRVLNNSHSSASALSQFMAKKPYRKYYIINQDYAAGRDFGKAFKQQLKMHIPDAEIVGEDYHPIGQKDFGPYITKVIAAKADAIFTGNWGPDVINLIKQARSLGLKVPFPFVCVFGVDPYMQNELKDDAVGIHHAYCYVIRVQTPENEQMIAKWHAKHKDDKDFLTWWPVWHMGVVISAWKMVLAGVEKAGSLDPEKFIDTFEGFSYKTPVGVWTMRKCDHQVLLPMFCGTVQGGWNPYYNGSIRADVKFPWLGPDIVEIPADKCAIPATPEYNPRCK